MICILIIIIYQLSFMILYIDVIYIFIMMVNGAQDVVLKRGDLRMKRCKKTRCAESARPSLLTPSEKRPPGTLLLLLVSKSSYVIYYPITMYSTVFSHTIRCLVMPCYTISVCTINTRLRASFEASQCALHRLRTGHRRLLAFFSSEEIPWKQEQATMSV